MFKNIYLFTGFIDLANFSFLKRLNFFGKKQSLFLDFNILCALKTNLNHIYIPYKCPVAVLVYVDIDQGIYKVKLKVALNEKRKN